MNTRILFPTGLLALAMAGCSSSSVNDSTAPSLAGIARAVLESVEAGNSADFSTYVSADTYIQHNLGSPDGSESIITAIDSGALAGTTVETFRAFEDGDIVFLHSIFGGTWNGGVPQVSFDVFRFENGLIVEHWDNLAAVEDDADGSTQTDGTLASDTGVDTESSRELVANAIDALFIKGEWSTIADYFDEDNYAQHSVGAGSDYTGLAQIATQLPEGTPFYSSLKYVHAQNDFVLSMSEGFPDADTGLSDAYYDLFRVADGQIVEHWDIIQTIPSQDTWVNENGKW